MESLAGHRRGDRLELHPAESALVDALKTLTVTLSDFVGAEVRTVQHMLSTKLNGLCSYLQGGVYGGLLGQVEARLKEVLGLLLRLRLIVASPPLGTDEPPAYTVEPLRFTAGLTPTVLWDTLIAPALRGEVPIVREEDWRGSSSGCGTRWPRTPTGCTGRGTRLRDAWSG